VALSTELWGRARGTPYVPIDTIMEQAPTGWRIASLIRRNNTRLSYQS
jgi:hypothetical protein